MTAARVDFLEFAWVWNAAQGLGTPAVHRRIARWLQARRDARDRRLLLMAFRGCGKSTLVGLYCAWSLLREPDSRILVLAADHELAVKMVATVRRVLERHPLCRALVPDAPESWAMDRFTVRRRAVLRDPSMLAQGLSGNITGARADLIVCDDVEVAGNCDTPAKRAELRERLAETEFVLTPGGTILYVGTPHCADTLYLPPGHADAWLVGYRRLVVPLLDAAGESAWPERFPAPEIAALRSRVGPLRFARQMLLQPVAEAAARLDPALVVRYAEEPEYREAGGRAQLSLMGRRLVSGGGFWDPAYGRPGAGDASVLAATYADGEGNHLPAPPVLPRPRPGQPGGSRHPAMPRRRRAGAGAAAAGGARRDQRHRPLPARAAQAGDGARRRALRGGGACEPAGQAPPHPGRAGAGAGGAPPARARGGVPHALPGGDGGVASGRPRRRA